MAANAVQGAADALNPAGGNPAAQLWAQERASLNAIPAVGFQNSLVTALGSVEKLGQKSNELLHQAATGKLENVHDYTIAATQAKLATELTVAIRNKAVAAFNEIMRMQA